MSVKLIEVNLCSCDLCGHEWITRVVPERCARCKRWNWNNGGLTKAELARAASVLERRDAAERRSARQQRPAAATRQKRSKRV